MSRRALFLWSVPYHPARALLLERGIYLLLTLDTWVLMLEHGGRYGMGGFNVAHFDFLDALLPHPDPRLYLGLVSFSGLLACVGALGQLSRIGKLTLFGVYTAAWAISMHDSYQHHYLLSWLLAFLLCLPALSVAASGKGGAVVRGAGLPLCAVCCLILYFFTAVSKSSPLWRSGAVLRALASSGGPLAWGPQQLVRLGVAESDAWHFAAVAVASVQIVIAIGYALCTFRDSARRRDVSALCSVACVSAVSFHVCAEIGDAFAIGWFSYYMLWLALVLLGPAQLLERIVAVLAQVLRILPGLPARPSSALMATIVCSGLTGLYVARAASLPGVGEAVAAFVTVWVLAAARRWQHGDPRAALRAAVLPCLTCSLLHAALSLGAVRFDYYRLAAGELSHMGRLEEALLLYRKAEEHAPAHDSRRGKIKQLERHLAKKALLKHGGEGHR